MRRLTFKWDEPKPLESVLTIPFYRVSMQLHASNPALPNVVTFWRVDGTWVEVYSVMHDVVERSEVGVLTFAMVPSRPEDQEVAVDMEPNPFVPAEVKKLVIREEDVTAESGITLISDKGKIITVAASAFPCALAVEGVRDDIPGIFDPEYEIDRYEVVPL